MLPFFNKITPPRKLLVLTAIERDDVLKQVLQLLLESPKVKHKLTVEPSRISQDAGLGVFSHGSIQKGDVVALYPGKYYPPLPVWAVTSSDTSSGVLLTNERLKCTQNNYIIHCNEIGGFIDGSAGAVPANLASRYAVAQLINHPAQTSLPNVWAFSFNWNAVVDLVGVHQSFAINVRQLASQINTVGEGPWYLDVVNGAIMDIPPSHPWAGICFIALDDIEDG